MFEIIKAVTWAQALSVLTVIGWWLLATGLVNLVAHRSQVDAWCEKNPKLAGSLKLIRSFGWDPWLLVQAFTLFVKGRLPEKLRNSLPILVTLLALLLTGCAGSFEVARLSGDPKVLAASNVDRSYCRKLDNDRTTWGAIAKGSAVLSGASGITAIPIDSKEAQIGLAAGALAAGTTAVVAVYVSEAKGEAWARDCAQ